MEQITQKHDLSASLQQLGPGPETLHAPDFNVELDEIRSRYQSRTELSQTIWDPLLPYNLMFYREKWAALATWIKSSGLQPVGEKRLLEIGCGLGEDLLYLVAIGFSPENIVANELVEDRALQLRRRLPAASEIIAGDASQMDFGDGQFDVVYQSLVFSSILNEAFQRKLANRMWSMAKTGGGVLWYDFIYNNRKNPHVRGLSVDAVRELFPEGRLNLWRLTLAPPIGRFVTRFWPGFYTVFRTIPLLRTHVLCWIQKT